ncbi:hypothetical protein V8F20_006690 [Naviculisporaceae sp. PSN 640]
MKASIRLCVQYSAPHRSRFRISLSKPAPTAGEGNKTEHETETQDAKKVSRNPRSRLRIPISVTPTEKQQTNSETQQQEITDEPTNKPRLKIRRLKSKTYSTNKSQAEPGTVKQQDPSPRHEKDFALNFDWPPFHIDPENKQVKTVSGTLPLSPIMDPTFHEARGKYTIKAKERGPPRSEIEGSGLDLWNNIYARALATPVRTCAVTKAALPKFFHTKFINARNPNGENNWLVPEEVALNTDGQMYLTKLDGAGAYFLCRQQLYREFFTAGTKYWQGHARIGKLAARSRREIIGSKTAVWREDMDSYLLDLLRSHITQCLIRFAGMVETAGRKYITKAGSWDEAGQYLEAGCFLYLRPEQGMTGQETVDGSERPSIPPPPAFMKLKDSLREWEVPIYDLRTLLGESNVERLRKRKELWREGEIFLLRGKRTHKLQLQFWRLLGYKATEEGLPAVENSPRRLSHSDDSIKASHSDDSSHSGDAIETSHSYDSSEDPSISSGTSTGPLMPEKEKED